MDTYLTFSIDIIGIINKYIDYSSKNLIKIAKQNEYKQYTYLKFYSLLDLILKCVFNGYIGFYYLDTHLTVELTSRFKEEVKKYNTLTLIEKKYITIKLRNGNDKDLLDLKELKFLLRK